MSNDSMEPEELKQQLLQLFKAFLNAVIFQNENNASCALDSIGKTLIKFCDLKMVEICVGKWIGEDKKVENPLV